MIIDDRVIVEFAKNLRDSKRLHRKYIKKDSTYASITRYYDGRVSSMRYALDMLKIYRR